MRKTFGDSLAKIVRQDKHVYLLVSDTGYGVFNDVPKDRFINLGLTEQATIGIMSGMAMEGLKPWGYAITPFIIERPYEFVKLDIVEQKANVKLVGYWDYPDSGKTHESRDIVKLCNLLEIKLFKPSNKTEIKKMVKEMHKSNEPSFLYLTKLK